MLLHRILKQQFFSHVRFASTIELTRDAVGTKPLEWNDILKWIENDQTTELWRDAFNAQRYIDHQQFVAREYRSINDFIRIKYLQWDIDFDKSTQKRIAIPGLTSIREPLLTPNDFPYYVLPHIQHWLMWCDPKPTEPEKIIEQIINQRFPVETFDRISFVNPPRSRSVSGVFHAHIFTKEKREG